MTSLLWLVDIVNDGCLEKRREPLDLDAESLGVVLQNGVRRKGSPSETFG